jgi:type II secretory pathway component GspD/PulD (secretin)
MIAVKNTSATPIAEIIREVYQEKMVSANRQRQPSPEEFIQLLRGGGGSSSGRGGSSGGSRGRNTAADAQKMTVGVDTRTNSLIVAAPQQLFDEVKQMVETLDTATSENNTAVKVVALQRSNASTVQKALSAIAGEKVRGGQVADTSSSGGGGSSSSRSSSEADQMRQRIEMFNSLRGGSSGGSPFGGGSSPFGGFGSRGGDSGSSRSFGSGGFPGGSSGGSRDSSRGSGR